jgi:hypothetical protein
MIGVKPRVIAVALTALRQEIAPARRKVGVGAP